MKIKSLFAPNKIIAKLLLFFTPFIILISLLIVINAPKEYKKQAIEAKKDKTQSIGRMLAYSLSPALYFEDADTVKEILLSAEQNKDLAYIVVVNSKGKTIASWNLKTAEEQRYLQAGNGILSAADRIYNLAVPVIHRNMEVGRLYLALSLDDVLSDIFVFRQKLILFGIAIFFVGVIVIFLMSSLITRPLRRVAETAGRIARGDLTQRAPVTGRDEVGKLARAFNTMVQNLESVQQNLENRVFERTRELQNEISERKKAEIALRESEELFRRMVESLGEGVMIVDPLQRISFANPAAHSIFGVPPGELPGKSLKEFTRTEQYGALLEETQKRRKGEKGTYEMEIIRPAGRRAVLLVTSMPRFTTGEEFAGSLGVFADITERKKSEEAVKEANERLRVTIQELEQRNTEMALLSELYDLFQTCRMEQEIFSFTGRYAQQLFPDEPGALYLFRASRNLLESVAVWGSSPPRAEFISPEDCWALRRSKLYILERGESGLICPHVEADGRGRLPYLCIPMVAQGETVGLIHLYRDAASGGLKTPLDADEEKSIMERTAHLATNFTERVALALVNLRLSEKLRQQSVRDPLTGLLNRRYLEEALVREVYKGERKGTPTGVVMLDIDNFKHFNDTYGHEAGDQMLKALAAFLQSHVRREDIVCRFGGEEFTLILPDSATEVVRHRTETLMERLKILKIVYMNQTLGPITLSMGIAVCPNHGNTEALVLQAADLALLRAKKAGRNRIVVSGE